MFSMILRTHWTWTRMPVLGIAFVAFLIPAAAWRLAGAYRFSNEAQLIDAHSVLGPLLALLAMLGAFVLAVYPWTLDAETKHVYPLALPISWSRYVSMRYCAGALTLLLPAAALYVGSQLAVAMIELPPLLRAYPGALALRFLLATLVAYSFTFALQYLAGRRATIVALVLVLGLVTVLTGLSMVGAGDLSMRLGRFLFDVPGPFGVFTQSWSLIDV